MAFLYCRQSSPESTRGKNVFMRAICDFKGESPKMIQFEPIHLLYDPDYIELMPPKVCHQDKELLEFTLSQEQVGLFDGEDTWKILLRCCLPDTGQEDRIPRGLGIIVNGERVSVATRTAPVDITFYCSLDGSSNKVQLIFGGKEFKDYGVGLFMAKCLTLEKAVEVLKTGIFDQSCDWTQALVTKDFDAGLKTIRLSLTCPLSRNVLQIPCKGANCDHVLCFDAKPFLELNLIQSEWTCPVCTRSIGFNDLRVDGFMKRILEDTNYSCKEVDLDSKNSWIPVGSVTHRSGQHTQAQETFKQIFSVPKSHKYYRRSMVEEQTQYIYTNRVGKEIQWLKASLPPDILVKGFEDRIDLYSAMIKGPKDTPYEDCLFLFDMVLPYNYPFKPPSVHYLSFENDRINPNLYVQGKVCVSLLGTWAGEKTGEVWTNQSTILQVFLSIQSLILVAEPYFNEPGYERDQGTPTGEQRSRQYNQNIVVRLVESMTKMVSNPPEVFEEEILRHFRGCGHLFIQRMDKWASLAKTNNESLSFPLLPATPEFVTNLEKATRDFEAVLKLKNLMS